MTLKFSSTMLRKCCQAKLLNVTHCHQSDDCCQRCRHNAADGRGVIGEGARDMDSTPPAIARSISPALMARATMTTASMPEPKNRLTVTPGMLSGRLTTAPPCAPRCGCPHPPGWRNRGSPRPPPALSRPGCFSISALMGIVVRSPLHAGWRQS